MSPAGRPINATGVNSLNRNHVEDRRLRPNHQNNNNNRPSTTRRPSTSQTKHHPNDIRIMAILESVPSTISVSAHHSDTLPTDFSSLTPRNEEHSDEEFQPEERKIGAKPSSFKRPSFHGMKKGLRKQVGRIRQHSLTPSSNNVNGMPPPSPQAPSKMNFRARALDPQKQMPVQIVKCNKKAEKNSELEMLYNNKVLKRPLFNVPSGMEKEEEREHHLRKAIEAQKAQTSGTVSGDHFIPIRDVELVTNGEYKAYCKWRSIVKPREYLDYRRGEFDFCDDNSYDADEQDLEFLQENKFFIDLNQYEKIIEKLEIASRERVPSLHEFHQQHPELVLEHLERVYDFWISRRMKLIREFKMPASLIHYVPGKNKPGEKDNPYIAFRHRGPKVQTRRKQKLDTEHYGTMLKLAAAIRRTHILTKAMVERDTIKLKLAEKNAELFDEELEFLEQGGSNSDLRLIYPTERQIVSSIPYANKWLSKVWNEVAREIFNTKPLNREENILAIATRHGPEDGRYAFHKHPSCTYRTHHSTDPNHPETSSSRSRAIQAVKRKLNDNMDSEAPRRIDSSEQEMAQNRDLLDGFRSRFVNIGEDTWEKLTGEHRTVFCRSRFGRGGRLKLDFLYK